MLRKVKVETMDSVSDWAGGAEAARREIERRRTPTTTPAPKPAFKPSTPDEVNRRHNEFWEKNQFQR